MQSNRRDKLRDDSEFEKQQQDALLEQTVFEEELQVVETYSPLEQFEQIAAALA